MRDVSLTALRSMLSQQVEEVFLKILKVEHPDLVTPLLFVGDRQDLVRADGTYVAFGFGIELPSDEEENISVVNLIFPIVDQAITQELRSVNTPFTITLSIVRASAPDTVEVGPFVFESIDMDFEGQQTTIMLAFNRNMLEDAFPKDIFTLSNRPPPP